MAPVVLQHYQLESGPAEGAGISTHQEGVAPAAGTSERMSGSAKYYQTKQLPATPKVKIETQQDTTNLTTIKATGSTSTAKTGSASDPVSARPPPSATTPRLPFSLAFPVSGSDAVQLAAGFYARPPPVQTQHAAMVPDQQTYPGNKIPSAAAGISTPFHIPSSSSAAAAAAAAASRAESISSTSGATTHSGRTMFSVEPPTGADVAALQQRPFVVRNGRSYIADPTLHYPLPVDLAELHRQSLRTLLLFQLFGGPVCSPVFGNRPPTRVLEVGCGSAFWSLMCHRYFARHGHTNISFTGIDIAPVAPGASGHGTSTKAASTVTGDGAAGGGGHRASTSSTLSGIDGKPDKDMRWRFVQHDIRRLPWPFADGEFDLVMVKDMSLATPLALQQTLIDEYVRLLRPGGVLEIWESDYTLRMLRPHVPNGGQQQQTRKETRKADDSEEDDDDDDDDTEEDEDSEEDEHEAAANLGAYLMTANTPLSAPTNNYLVEYNAWVAKALEARSLSAVPCTLIGSLLLQEVETLSGLGSKRLAVPLSEVRWEREGVGGVVTKDGKSYIESTKGYRGAAKRSEAAGGGKPLGPGQAAVRRTALMTVVQQMQSLEAVLREVSGKSQDEWDGWCGKMMNDLVKENGTSWGECLEIGAWWARKKA